MPSVARLPGVALGTVPYSVLQFPLLRGRRLVRLVSPAIIVILWRIRRTYALGSLDEPI